MERDIYFRCEACGKRIREYEGKKFIHPKIEPPPLRMVLLQRKKTAGRQLCDACWEEWRESVREVRKKLDE